MITDKRKEYNKTYYGKNKEKRKEYNKVYNQDHRKEHKKDNRRKRLEFKLILKNLKINGCAICDSHKHLEFHHTLPTDKKFSISQGAGYSSKVLSDELNKCILLCRKHHKEL